ncbi:MAG TPA: hypothetical protein VM094_07040 [Gemmatimonadales bacterium]|nr:hypothetical protein [Gemmatimonadales bacterium]
MTPDVLATGSVLLYRLWDLGDEIDLQAADRLFADSAPARRKPGRFEARALSIPTPPLVVSLGTQRLVLGQEACDIECHATLFDFGVASVRLHVTPPTSIPWPRLAELVGSLAGRSELEALAADRRDHLLHRLGPAVRAMQLAGTAGDYTVVRLTGLHDAAGAPCDPRSLEERQLAELLLPGGAALDPRTLASLLGHRSSYTTRDLTVLSWDAALVVEPDPADRDVEQLLEFANAQLLELRVYDARLDGGLREMSARIGAARRHAAGVFTGSYRALLIDLLTVVADVSELVERAENALKVTDDVYLGRVYSDAMRLFRADVWRADIARKLETLRATYTMLHDETQTTRAHLLEIAIVLLFVIDIALALLRR